MQSNKDTFIQLIRLGIGTSKKVEISSDINWYEVKALADKHGLSALVLDGVEHLKEIKDLSLNKIMPPQGLLLGWIGEVLQTYENRYIAYRKVISEMAKFYNTHGLKMMVLKGYACSLNWPRPEHRPCGDIDIWQFGRYLEGDALIALEKGVKVDNSHHHHTVFMWRDFMVENHYDFLNIYHHKSNVEIEKILKDLGNDDSNFVELYGEKVYLPSANLHALFLLRHAMSNFASTGMSMRQLLDWGFFVEKHGMEIDWPWLMNEVEKYGMRPAFDCFNEILTDDLGFDFNFDTSDKFDVALKERVLNDILSPEFSEKGSSGIVSRAFFKFRRWRANGWKHRLCFSESMWSAFWSGVVGHLKKPRMI